MHTHQALEQKDRCLAIEHHGMSTYFYFCLKLCLLPMYPYCSYLITMSVACWRRNKDYLLTYLLTRWLCSSPHDKLSFLAHRHCSVQRLLCLIVQSAVNVGEMLDIVMYISAFDIPSFVLLISVRKNCWFANNLFKCLWFFTVRSNSVLIHIVRSLSVSFFIEKEPHSSQEWNERGKAKGGGRDTTSACELGHSCIAQGYCAS